MEAPSRLEADLGWDHKNRGHILQREVDIHEFLLSHDAGKRYIGKTTHYSLYWIIDKLPIFYEYICLGRVSTIFRMICCLSSILYSKTLLRSLCKFLHALQVLKVLRWYGTPCNIFKDNRILKNDYKHGFKNFKICNICPKNSFIKYHKRNKKENRCMIRTRDPQIASLPFNQLSYAESYQK